MKKKRPRVFHYLHAKWALEDLQKSRIKLSVFDKLNDPHELRAYRVRGFADRDWDRYVHHVADRYAILCFSRSSTDPCMWKRYGDQGAGICLGFDLNRTVILDPVKYVDDVEFVDFPPHLMPLFEAGTTLRPFRREKLFNKAVHTFKPVLTTKFKPWEEERELRGYFRKDQKENGFYFSNFRQQGSGLYVQEVILGSNCSVSEHEVYAALKSYPKQPITVRHLGQLST